MIVDRRRLVAGLGIGGGALLSGCDRIAATPAMRGFFMGTEALSHDLTRVAAPRQALAPEFSRADLSPVFRSNGTARPGGADYAALATGNFADWRLIIDGLVARPLALSLADLVRRPSRTQITRHDCVEGWSAIGQWTGTPLAHLLAEARLLAAARYVVFHCYDDYPGGRYYESLDLTDAVHPQTILAWGLNGHRLPIANGAPLRLRVERQLGYKQAKYLQRIELASSLKPFGLGKGGYWEDSTDYAWYAGI